jgi:hypothetical protein
MRRCGDEPRFAFPLPPQDEVAAMTPTAPHYALCHDDTAGEIRNVYGRIRARDPDPARQDVEVFGRYLFATLLGDAAWQVLCDQAGAEPIELALIWDEAEWELNRLPWEMMHGPNTFLVAEPGRPVAITRLVAGANSNGEMDAIQVRPRVLFVVGADLSDPAIQPGAEYLGLLRRLKAAGVGLNSCVLLEATSQKLKDAMDSFRPSVVHFISHGGVDSRRGYLEMMPDDASGQRERRFAEQLLLLLETEDGLPPIVVLNACHSGTPPVAQVAAPLAVELVKGGIPIVVGMAGRVADRACRLFTRRFYEALLQGESVIAATAEGRRAGIEYGADPRTTVDWAFPAIFLAEEASPRIAVQSRDQATRREHIALRYHTLNNPPVFCNRLDFLQVYRELIHADGAGAPRVLAVEVAHEDQRIEDPRYGKTRLLEEMAAQAVRDGHVSCLVTFAQGDRLPSTPLEVGMAILRAIRTTRAHFGLNTHPGFELLKLKQKIENPDDPVDLDQEVRDEIGLQGSLDHGSVVSAALRLDLSALAAEARQRFPDTPDLRVLVLIDDAHRFDAAARDLVENLLGHDGLGRVHDPVPVVFAFSGIVVKPEYSTAVQALKTFLEQNRPYVRHLRLEAFRSPAEDRLAYQQFLLYYQPPLVVRYHDAQPQDIEGLFEEFHTVIRGEPSRLKIPNEAVEVAIRMARRFRLLEEANDEDVLQQMRGHTNGG